MQLCARSREMRGLKANQQEMVADLRHRRPSEWFSALLFAPRPAGSACCTPPQLLAALRKYRQLQVSLLDALYGSHCVERIRCTTVRCKSLCSPSCFLCVQRAKGKTVLENAG